MAVCKMKAGTSDTEWHNQEAAIVYSNVCTEYELDLPKSRQKIPQNVAENKKTKIL